MAHMLAIKFYTGNMVDCQLPECERSFWLSEIWLGLHILLQSSGSTAPKHISRIPWWATGQEQGWKCTFPPQGKLYFCHILQAVSQGFPILHTLSLSKPHILGLEFQSTVPAQSLALAAVQLAPCSSPQCRESRHEPTANTNQIPSQLLLPLISCLLH